MQGLETPDKKIERLKYYSTHYDELLQQLSKMSWWQRWKFRKELVYCLPKLADCYTVEAYFERRIYDWSAWWVDFRYKLNSDIFNGKQPFTKHIEDIHVPCFGGLVTYNVRSGRIETTTDRDLVWRMVGSFRKFWQYSEAATLLGMTLWDVWKYTDKGEPK